MSGQTRGMSAFETCTSTVVGYVVAVSSQAVIFPFFGLYVPLTDNLIMGLFFTVVSVVRGYWVRRLFNWVDSVRHARQ